MVAAAGTALAVTAGVLWLRADVVETVSVVSDSMRPTLCPGDRLVVLRPGAGARARAGRLVVFRAPGSGAATVKRVVAVEGQRVEIRDGVLHVDGAARHEPYVRPETVDGWFFGPVAVPAGAVFVLGDARETSVDSRDYGPVALSRVDGVVVARVGGACEAPGSAPHS